MRYMAADSSFFVTKRSMRATFASTNPVKPESTGAISSVGGHGGPIIRSSSSTTRAAADHRSHGDFHRPDALQRRQGVFTGVDWRASAGHLRPSDDGWQRAHAVREQHHSGQSHGTWSCSPSWRDIRCRRAAEQPTTSSVLAMKRRTRTSSACGLDQQFADNRDHVFGASRASAEQFPAGDTCPTVAVATTGTLGPQDTTSHSFVHITSARCRRTSNEVRGRHTPACHAVGCDAVRAAVHPSAFRGFPSTARFPNTLPTMLISGYQQLGSPANTASDFPARASLGSPTH